MRRPVPQGNSSGVMNSEHWRARALIDAGALRHNLAVVRALISKRAPDCRVMAVIKSNAYGHGMATVSRAIAERVDAFAVATLREGIDCRAANPSLPVTVLSGLDAPSSLDLCSRYRLEPVVHTPAHLQWVEAYRGAPLTLWLKIDTGMNRLGIAPGEVADAVARLGCSKQVEGIRLMSHLANADDPEDNYTDTQLRRFKQCTDEYKLVRSLANSAAVMKWPQTHFHWVRPGIMLYGGSPLTDCRGPQLDLRPAMQLEARLLSVKEVEAGQPLGYGGSYVTPAAARIGVVGFGYGDGYPRVLSPAAEVLICGDDDDGTRAPVLGRVAMDMLTVDLSRCRDAAIGRKVVLWGAGLSVDEVAHWAGTISYELLCKVGERVSRVTVEEIDGQT